MTSKKKRFGGVWRAKWTADGATSVAEMARMMRAEADHLDAMAKAGIVLPSPVQDDYAFLETEDAVVAERYGFHLPEDEEVRA